MAKKTPAGTPALTALAAAGVTCTVHTYQHDPGTASYGLEAAQALGVDPARVFKTLVASVDGRLAVAVVPVTGSLDLKALARRRRRQSAPCWPIRRWRSDPRVMSSAGSARWASAKRCPR